MAAEIDRIDRRILQHLQQDARMTNADLAKAVHVSTATCHRRTQRLFQEGYIHTVRAEIAPARVEPWHAGRGRGGSRSLDAGELRRLRGRDPQAAGRCSTATWSLATSIIF